MEHRIDWQLGKDGAFFTLAYSETVSLTLTCGRLTQELNGLQGALSLYRLGRWIVQRHAGKLYVFCLATRSDDLRISFGNNATVTAQATLAGPQQWTKQFPKATSFIINNSRLTVTDKRTETADQNGPSQQTNAAALAQLQAERDSLRQQLNTANQRVSASEARIAELDNAALDNSSKLMTAQARIVELEQQLDAIRQLTDANTQLDASRADINEIRGRLEEVQRANGQAQAEITQLNNEFSEAQSQQLSLQATRNELEDQIRQLQHAKLDAATASRELTELDVEACSQQLAAQRQELLSDTSALTLLQHDGSIKCISVVENQAECARLLDYIETRISAIVKLRERIDQLVWRTIDTGENGGSIPQKAEAGEF